VMRCGNTGCQTRLGDSPADLIILLVDKLASYRVLEKERYTAQRLACCGQ
jgi:hypothetical protein